MIWQPAMPENLHHLPLRYYEQMRTTFSARPDLVRRFVDGEFGFQQVGKSVTPQWNDKIHLGLGLSVVPRHDIYMFWDFGHNPTCLVAQKTPLGYLNFLDGMVGDQMGVEELIENWARPLWIERYKPLNCDLRLHIGDPAGVTKEQTSYNRSAVRSLRQLLPSKQGWRAGPVKPNDRIPALQAQLTRVIKGRGLIQVDRERCACLWHALRGGWHHHIARTGLVSGLPYKDIHSHPGDAASYGVAVLFPLGKVSGRPAGGLTEPEQPGYFGGNSASRGPAAPQLVASRPGMELPNHGDAPLAERIARGE